VKALDTTFLVDYLAEPTDGPAGTWLAAHEDDVFATPTLCLQEVYRGATLSSGSDTVEDLATGLGWAEPLPFTEASAREAAAVEAELQAAGTPVNRMDALIAGVVRAVGAPIVTADSHFDAVEGLDVVRYDEADE
jgi:predicted nucleic acid-binding protein